MNILAFFNREKDSVTSASVAKHRLQIAVGKTSIDIDNVISDLKEVIYDSLAKYAINTSNVCFKQKNNKVKIEIAVK